MVVGDPEMNVFPEYGKNFRVEVMPEPEPKVTLHPPPPHESALA